MATAQTLIDGTRSRLLSGVAESRNRLVTTHTIGTGTVALEFDTLGISAGTRLGIGLSVFHVFSCDPVSRVASVVVDDGSADVTYTAGTLVRVNPRFTDYRIFTEINNDLADLAGRGLYQMKPYEFTYTSDRDAFNLPLTDLLEEYALWFETPGARRDWKRLDRMRWRIERLANTTDFSSGVALKIFQALNNGYKARLHYKAPFVPFAAVTDDVTTTGLPSSGYDLPELGAAMSLLSAREVKRSFIETQADPRRSEQVPAGGMLRAYQGLSVERNRRIATELARLNKQWPVRS
jgi:hypothetical protein